MAENPIGPGNNNGKIPQKHGGSLSMREQTHVSVPGQVRSIGKHIELLLDPSTSRRGSFPRRSAM